MTVTPSGRRHEGDAMRIKDRCRRDGVVLGVVAERRCDETSKYLGLRRTHRHHLNHDLAPSGFDS
jgi:hypothetical protein